MPDQHITTADHPTKEIAAMKVNEAHDCLIHFIYTQVCSVTKYRTQNTVVKQESKQETTCNISEHIPLIKTVRNLTFLELAVHDYTYYQGRNCLGPNHYFLQQERKYLIHNLHMNNGSSKILS